MKRKKTLKAQKCDTTISLSPSIIEHLTYTKSLQYLSDIYDFKARKMHLKHLHMELDN